MSAKILIVDDSSLARRTTRRLLEELGHTVEEAVDGNQAIERYFLHRHDLVILDMVMSGMYGLEVLARLKEIDPKVPVIVATADIQTSTRADVRAAGASAFVNKPLQSGALSAAIDGVMKTGASWN